LYIKKCTDFFLLPTPSKKCTSKIKEKVGKKIEKYLEMESEKT
jgi:hypothetical protein